MKFSSAIALTILAASANGYELLKDYAKGFRIGCATNTIHYNNSAYVNAMKAFNYMVAENGCKFVSIQGTKGKFNFNDCDNHLKKANELGMAFRGHALIWHSMAPKWLENEDSNTMKQSIINHITTVLKHYEGKIDTWDVVNEAIDDGSNGNGWKMRNSFLYQKVPNFIDIAFQTARQVSPKTKLFYNDYNTEGIWAKSESVYQFVADLKKRNIPIDGVGIQYHVGVDVQPKFDSINNLIGRYCKLGVEVHITELDVSCDSSCNDRDGGDGKQGQVYTNALKACLNNSCCTGFLVWGVGDNDSWREGKNKPLLFNSNYQPKGQYTAVLNLLKSTPESVLKNRAGASVQPTQPAEPLGKVVKLNDGWYNIKNPASGKYLCVMDGVGANDQNVEICSTKQKWKLTNGSDNTVTLTTEFGEYNLDVAKGKDENGANIITYRINGGKNQKFIIRDSSTANAYSITTSISNGLRALDIEKEGKVDGANILQWDNGQRSNQIWNFEATSAPSAPQDNPSPSPSTCWSESLGYKCCSSCDVNVQYTDNDGAWGIENNEWCGVPKNCSATCTGAQGYPCCKSNCDVYSTDDDGDWSVENGGWCLINKAKC